MIPLCFLRSRRVAVLLPLIALAVVVLATPARTSQRADGKLPEPDKTALAKSENTLRKMFKDELAKAKEDSATARELSNLLLREAKETNEDPALRFAALSFARDLAAGAGDITGALAAIEDLSKAYAVDALAMKARMLTLASEKTTAKDDHVVIVETALEFLEEALINDKYKVAEELVKAAEESGVKSKNLQLPGRVEKRKQEVDQAKKEFGRMQNFVAILEKTPDDQKANSEMGKYYCLVKGNWELGLPMLVKGQDKVFLEIAKRDLARPQETRAVLELADDFADMADKEKGLSQKNLLKRAHYWYVRCLPQIPSGLNKIRVEKAIEDIAKLFPASPAVVTVSSTKINSLIRVFEKQHINGGVQALAISPDNKWVLSGGAQDNIVRLWSLAEGKQVRMLVGHQTQIFGVAFSQDGTLCASASQDKTMRTWDVSTGQIVRVFGGPNGHIEWVKGVYFIPGKTRIVTAADDKTLRVWDLKDGSTITKMGGHTDWITGLSVTKDGKRAATCSEDRTVRVWDLEKGQEIANFLHNQKVIAVTLSPDGKWVASATDPANFASTVRIWDVAAKKELRTLQVPTPAYALAFAPSGKTLAVGTGGLVNFVPPGTIEGGWPNQGGFDFSVYFFDAETGKALRRLPGHNGNVKALAYSSDGRYLVSGGDDGMIRLWGGATKK